MFEDDIEVGQPKDLRDMNFLDCVHQFDPKFFFEEYMYNKKPKRIRPTYRIKLVDEDGNLIAKSNNY